MSGFFFLYRHRCGVASIIIELCSFNVDNIVYFCHAAKFIAFLEQHNPAAFKATLERVTRKQSMGEAIGSAYGLALPALWTRFLEKARADFNRKSERQAGPSCSMMK